MDGVIEGLKVKYDDEKFSSEGWLQMLQEKKLMDDQNF